MTFKEYIEINSYETSIRHIHIDSYPISDLYGIEEFIFLESIYIIRNNIIDLSPLSKLVYLVRLDLTSNYIVDITPLKNLNIVALYLTNNKIKDISSLCEITTLKEIYISNNFISNFYCLSCLPKLKVLSCHNNDDYKGVAYLPLSQLYIDNYWYYDDMDNSISIKQNELKITERKEKINTLLKCHLKNI